MYTQWIRFKQESRNLYLIQLFRGSLKFVRSQLINYYFSPKSQNNSLRVSRRADEQTNNVWTVFTISWGRDDPVIASIGGDGRQRSLHVSMEQEAHVAHFQRRRGNNHGYFRDATCLFFLESELIQSPYSVGEKCQWNSVAFFKTSASSPCLVG